MRLRAALLACAGLAACAPSAPTPTTPAGGYPVDIGEKQLPPDPGRAPEQDAYPKAPSADLACADDGERLPMSGVCRGRAINHMELGATPLAAAPGCDWANNEVWFGGDVMLYRGLVCGDKKVVLDYAGGAHAAELSYVSSALHPDAVPKADEVRPIVRVATFETNADFRLKETIGSDAAIARCEIKPAGAGFPAGAKVIAPKVAGADCGLYALSDKTDNFWIVGKAWVFAFMLPKGARDIDPASFTVVKPQ